MKNLIIQTKSIKRSAKIYISLFIFAASSVASAQEAEDIQKNNLVYVHSGAQDKFPVVVIDSGIDYTHPDLAPLLYKNKATDQIQIGPFSIVDDVFGWDFNENDAFSYDNVYSYTPKFTEVPEYNPEENFETNFSGIAKSLLKNFFEIVIASLPIGSPGHGTHVSGIILDHCNTCAIVPLKIFGKEDLSIESLSAAIEYAHRKGHRLVNMSLGVDTKYFKGNLKEQQHLEEVIKKIKSYNDMLFIVAAGNDGAYLSELEDGVYPAMLDLPNVITVGAIDDDGKLADFSNYDPKFIDVYAPGVEIESTWLDGEYKKVSGTSMSTPMVTGLIGSLWSQNTQLTVAQVKALFFSQTLQTQITYKELETTLALYVK
jgi:subtilisin family serine protease